MSQANVQPISNFAQFNRITTVTGDMLDTVFANNGGSIVMRTIRHPRYYESKGIRSAATKVVPI